MGGLFQSENLNSEELFWLLYKAKDESDVYSVLHEHPTIFNNDDNWRPLGNNKSNFSIVKNQQSNPIAALIEKLTNSIDATLMRRCYEEGIAPKGADAPSTMQEAVAQFFPNYKNWDLAGPRKAQSEEIQLIADGMAGPKGKGHHDTSVIIYDNGEGQEPKDFEDTFLSLIRGNKNNIQFVQGKYNMGGSGAIVFCGEKRYQLIASKRHNGEGEFGYTLIREHEKKESDQAKETWFEYLVIDGKIPSFPITEIDLGLRNRKFKTGSIIKMYSYQFPSGYSAFSQDLNQSINEFLFEPALPILTADTKQRYPKNKVLENPLYGLKRRLVQEEEKYLEKSFSEEFNDSLFGQMKVNGYVFKNRVGDEDVKKTKENIRKRYFKNNMSVLFSMNGQVHGFFTTEFITRTLKVNLLKNHLLIHVECTHMNYDFRKDLFMASRDRLNEGKKTQELRKYLGSKLGKKGGVLNEIEKLRKNAADIQSSADTKKMLVDFAKTLPKDSNMLKLLKQSLQLDETDDSKKKKPTKKPGPKREPKPFNPERFPSFFKTKAKNDGEKPVSKIPLGGEKTIQFETDVEDGFFDRTEEPGELQIGLLGIKGNETDGGNEKGEGKEVTDVFDVNKSSPSRGTIRISLTPKQDLAVDDEVQIRATLSSKAGDHEELFWVKIAEQEAPKEPTPKPDQDDAPIGLPDLKFAYQDTEGKEDAVTWEAVEDATGTSMGYEVVMVPQIGDDQLEAIFVNMDSTVLREYKSQHKRANEEQLHLANRKYFTSVYFHTLFLYTITKQRKYSMSKANEEGQAQEIDLGEYLQDLFNHYYTDFLLNYQMESLMEGLGD